MFALKIIVRKLNEDKTKEQQFISVTALVIWESEEHSLCYAVK